MTPSRILPDLQCSLLCEDVRQEVTGNFILIGVVGFVRVAQLPISALKLCLFNRWTAGIGQFTETVRLIAPDQTTLLRKNEMKFALTGPSQNATTVTVWGQVKFEAAGDYYVEVLVDDVMKLRFPIPITVVPPPEAPGEAKKGSMNPVADDSSPPPVAWQPLTFGGVAAFASAGMGRLILAGFIAAAIFGAGLVWFLDRSYCPVIIQAIQKMPETARVASGNLQGVADTLISESKLIAIAVTPGSAADIGQGADVQFQLRQNDFCVGSIFRPDWGLAFEYDRGASVNLSRSSLEPWWGAWQPVLLTGAGAGAVVVLLTVWAVLAVVYAGPAKFAAWFADRQLSWIGAGRLCFASMAPGALVMTFAIFLYGLHAIDLVQLSFFWFAHWVMGWVYVAGGVWALPRLFARAEDKNPFAL